MNATTDKDKNAPRVQEILGNYRIPTIALCVGITISIVGFLYFLNSNMKELGKEFKAYADLETSAIKYSFNGYQRSMELLQAFYQSSENVTEEEFKTFISPLFRRGNFVAFWWLPNKKDSNEFLILYSDGYKKELLKDNILLGDSFPEVADSIETVIDKETAKLSSPFAISEGTSRNHVAFSYPIIKDKILEGMVVGILDLKMVFSREVRWQENRNMSSVYIYTAADEIGESMPIYASEDENLEFTDKNTRLPSYDMVTKHAPFIHEDIIELPLSKWSLVFAPTNSYLSKATAPFPWIVLLFGIILTLIISMYLFSLVSRNLKVKSMVEEKTRELMETAAIKIENEKKISAIMDNTVDGLITINDQGLVESYNKACEQIFGYNAEEVIGKKVNMLMPEPYHSEHDRYLENYNRTGKAKVIGVGREVQGKHKDGRVFPLDLSVSKVDLGNRVIYSGIVRDISERKEVEKSLQQSVDALERSNEELERFAYIASHDLQEPLRMVTNFTGMLKKKYEKKLDKTAQDYIEFASNSAQRMQELVEDLLEYSRITRSTQRYEAIECEQSFKYVLDALQEAIKESRAEITVEDELPVIMGNPIRFSRLMQNLLANAIKYRKDGTPVKIRIRADDKKDAWMFSVEDNGIGMKQEYCEKIFLPFKRLHGKDEYSGTGIGLAVCKKIVESFGGSIWAKSEPGKGSTFYFTIPKKSSTQKKEKAA